MNFGFRSTYPPILYDHREDRSGVPDLLESEGGPPLVRTSLPAADYLVGRVAIERKSSLDFVSTLNEGRLFTQLVALCTASHRRLLIIENSCRFKIDLKRRRLGGALLSITAGLQVPIMITETKVETARLLIRLWHQEGRRGLHCQIKAPPKRHGPGRLQIIAGVPGIGIARAEKLLEHFGSIQRVFSADVADLCQVDGIGLTTAKRFVELLR